MGSKGSPQTCILKYDKKSCHKTQNLKVEEKICIEKVENLLVLCERRDEWLRFEGIIIFFIDIVLLIQNDTYWSLSNVSIDETENLTDRNRDITHM